MSRVHKKTAPGSAVFSADECLKGLVIRRFVLDYRRIQHAREVLQRHDLFCLALSFEIKRFNRNGFGLRIERRVENFHSQSEYFGGRSQGVTIIRPL